MTNSYPIVLQDEQYLGLSIEVWGIDAGLSLQDPDGHTVAQYICRHGTPTPISLIAEIAGTYRLEVQARENGSASGHYLLEIEKPRGAGPEDHLRVVAEKIFNEGETLRIQWKAEHQRDAIKKYEEAASLWHRARRGAEEAYALDSIAAIYQQFGEPQTALKYYQRSFGLSQKAHDHRRQAETLNGLSAVYLALGENQKALDSCTRALKLSREIRYQRAEARALHGTGEVYYYFGNSEKAIDYYQQALPIWRALSDRRGQAETLLSLGYGYAGLGDMRRALDSGQQALPLWEAVNDLRGQAHTLTAIGHFNSTLGEKQEAINLYNKAMPLLKFIGDQVGEARVLDGMGYVHEELGDRRKALEYYIQAAHLFQITNHRDGEAGHLLRIGEGYFSLGEYQKALDYYFRARAMLHALANKQMESYALLDIGMVYDSLGDKTKALDYYYQALSNNSAGKDRRGEVDTLNLIGRIYDVKGDQRKALDFYRRALPLSRETAYHSGEAHTLHHIARIERARGNLGEARAQVEAALKIIESLRNKVVSHDLRTSYFASVQQLYELNVDLLMRLHKLRPAEGFDAAAFEASERARARSMLETLAETHTDIRQGVDPVMLDDERSLKQALNNKAEQQMQLLGGSHSEEEAVAIAQEIDEITTRYEVLQAQIRASSPRYAALTQPQPLSLKEIQHQVLDGDTLLLEYALGDEKSYLWAATKDSIYGHELPERAEIEAAARRVYDLLKAHQPVPGETLAERQARAAAADAQYWQEAVALSRMILGPVAGQLENKRLLIVADGALQYIPFGALTVPEADTPAQANGIEHDREPVPLIVEHEIVNLPSASTLAVLRRETAQRAPAPNTVAVLADPVFERDDPRIPSGFRAQASATAEQREAEHTEVAELHRAVRDAGAGGPGGSIPRLLASREEAEAIMQVTPAGTGLNAIGFDASRATATSPELGKYRIVHFATHGLLNSEHPELSGVIFSLVNQQGQPVNGFLRLHDIYNLSLPADLVVLSACNTGLGKDVKGEGLIGLTRGFMYAGASSVMASLWKVDDEATAELMKHFYRGMLKDGLPPASALRQAQMEMCRQKPWRSPYYWAAFVLQGEYGRRIEIKGQTGVSAGQVVTAGALILALSVGGVLYAARRRRRNLVYTNPR